VITRLTALAGLAALAACDSSTAGGMGTVRLHLSASGTSTMISTASLVNFGDVTSATVTITGAELMPGNVEVPLGAQSLTFELAGPNADLVDGVTALLGVVPTLGEYEQLRLFVGDATVTVTLSDGSSQTFQEEALVPSGQQTGIKVNFGGPIEVGPGAVVDLVAVFDVDDSFVFQGPPDAPRDVSFKPVIHASTESWPYIAGNISLSAAPGGSGTAITVRAKKDNTVVAEQIVSVDATGTSAVFHLSFVPPNDTYIVTAEAAGYQTATSNPISVGEIGVVLATPLTLTKN
jgi:hypothetical protein